MRNIDYKISRRADDFADREYSEGKHEREALSKGYYWGAVETLQDMWRSPKANPEEHQRVLVYLLGTQDNGDTTECITEYIWSKNIGGFRFVEETLNGQGYDNVKVLGWMVPPELPDVLRNGRIPGKKRGEKDAVELENVVNDAETLLVKADNAVCDIERHLTFKGFDFLPEPERPHVQLASANEIIVCCAGYELQINEVVKLMKTKGCVEPEDFNVNLQNYGKE